MWNRIDLDRGRDKELITQEIEAVLDHSGYQLAETNIEKPWGGYYRIKREHTEQFLEEFFINVDLPKWSDGMEMDPKILFVAPEKRLSWQYHERRGEVWYVVRGPVGAYISETDTMPENPKNLDTGNTFQIHSRARHRLAGLENWGIVAEIWVHTDPTNPSNEEDIIRLQDDFGRVGN